MRISEQEAKNQGLSCAGTLDSACLAAGQRSLLCSLPASFLRDKFTPLEAALSIPGWLCHLLLNMY